MPHTGVAWHAEALPIRNESESLKFCIDHDAKHCGRHGKCAATTSDDHAVTIETAFNITYHWYMALPSIVTRVFSSALQRLLACAACLASKGCGRRVRFGLLRTPARQPFWWLEHRATLIPMIGRCAGTTRFREPNTPEVAGWDLWLRKDAGTIPEIYRPYQDGAFQQPANG